MSLTTGAEMVVTMSSAVATSNSNVPIWWKKPVTAMSFDWVGALLVDFGELRYKKGLD